MHSNDWEGNKPETNLKDKIHTLLLKTSDQLEIHRKTIQFTHTHTYMYNIYMAVKKKKKMQNIDLKIKHYIKT